MPTHADPSVGILLVNLGSPSAPTPRAVRRFLDEFLGDPLVVDLNPILWWLIRKAFVLPLRGRSSAALYREIWTPEGSPLTVYSLALRDGLREKLETGGADELPVELGMRYGEPSLEGAIERLIERGVDTIRLLSLFPQASRATTGTVEVEVRRVLAKLARQGRAPKLEIVPPYHDDAGFAEAIRRSVRTAAGEGPLGHVVFSLHGLPVRLVEEGDPYRDQCERTAEVLAAALELESDEWTLAYQSRFGREAWLEPDTAVVVPALARKHPRVVLLTPGFATDCLETLEEISLRLPQEFQEAGGEELVVVPCLNTDQVWIEALADIARREPEPRSGGS